MTSEQRVEEIHIQYMLGAHPNERVKLGRAYQKAKAEAMEEQKVCFNGELFSLKAVDNVLYPGNHQKKIIEPQYIGDIAELLGDDKNENAIEDGDRELPDEESPEAEDRKET